MTARASVILAEDDPDLRDGLVECLSMQGLDVVGVGTGLEFYQRIVAQSFDIAILDVGLPDQDGFGIAKVLSERTGMGIIVITARSRVEDRLNGFHCGADLYFVKPVDCRELAAAALNLKRRLLRARGPVSGGSPAEPPPEVWTLDRVHWTLRSPAGRRVTLTAKEVSFLECLTQNCGETTSRRTILAALGYADTDQGNRSLDALVRRLRRKIEAETGTSPPIQTVHAHGYVFSAPFATG